jgi:hypothetical protein
MRVASVLIAGVLLLVRQPLLNAELVTVRYVEGDVRAFLALSTLSGTKLADGEWVQSTEKSTVTARLSFRFKDGSLHEETSTFSQRQRFQLLSDHLVQKGPSFPQPLDATIDVASGKTNVRYVDHGEEKTESRQLAIPEDICNGIIPTLLRNVRPETPPKSFSFIAAMPGPRLVKLEIGVVDHERVSMGTLQGTATNYVLKVRIGGFSGALAPLVGKQPPDSHVWILEGDVPTFFKSEQPLYVGGPVWRIELTSPVESRTGAGK